ncbi:hypothetical protein TKK_0007130 [Trichogramma kaykai]
MQCRERVCSTDDELNAAIDGILDEDRAEVSVNDIHHCRGGRKRKRNDFDDDNDLDYESGALNRVHHHQHLVAAVGQARLRLKDSSSSSPNRSYANPARVL